MKTDQSCCGPAEAGSAGVVARQLKALAHPVRLEIIRQLAERSRCCTNDFCACLPLAQSTISQHLDLLRQSGLVRYAPDGNRSAYSLDRDALRELAVAVGGLAGPAAPVLTLEVAND